MRANLAVSDNISRIGQTVVSSSWEMIPQMVNTSYDVRRNEITLPAAFQQPPFFDISADDASNYGALGSVVGHEITHGFDDEGRHFDAYGNLKNWWTQVAETNFMRRIQSIRDQFDGYVVQGNLTSTAPRSVAKP